MKKRLFIVICIMMIFAIVPVKAQALSEPHDWRTSWDANQNNAYIDLLNAILVCDEEVSLQSDYITGTQLFNVLQRLGQEFPELEEVYPSSMTYTDEGYVDTVSILYRQKGGQSVPKEEMLSAIKETLEYTAFARSFVDDRMTDVEKALVLHDYIAQRTQYILDYESEYGIAAGIYLDHKGDCTNISGAYNQLLYSVGIPFGQASGHVHDWTVIKIDGKWYVSDATWATATEEEYVKYSPLMHTYFLCGKESHYEDDITCYYNSFSHSGEQIPADSIEYDNPAAYWNFSDCVGNIAYHAGAGASRGKLYYLTMGDNPGRFILTIRDSLYKDAVVETHPDKLYENITWANDVLYGYRDNVIYTIDWETLEETEIGHVQGSSYFIVDASGTASEKQSFGKPVQGITGIIGENGQLTARVTFEDGTAEEIAACTYAKVEAALDLEKSPVSGPSEEPDELQYGIFANNIINMDIYVSRCTDRFRHTNGYEVPDSVCGFPVSAIYEGAFRDIGPEQLAGELKLPKSVGMVLSHAFENCTGLSGDLDLSNVINLDNYAFYGCTGLDGKVILYPERNVFQSSFEGCSGIKSVENLSNQQSIYQSAFEGCTSLSGHYDFSGTSFLGERTFKDCSNIEIEPVIGASYIGESAFENCSKITGEISIPNCTYIAANPFLGTGITRLTGTEQLQTIRAFLLNNTEIGGIIDLPALTELKMFALAGNVGLTAIRLSNPDTQVESSSIDCFPSSTDVALFVVRGSALEDVIKEKWTYGENYWYIDDVIDSGELENGITWSVGADGVMHLGVSDGVTGAVTVPDFSASGAAWDDVAKYVQTLKVESGSVRLGNGSICNFPDLESVVMEYGSTFDEGAFAGCPRLDEANIVIADCEHTYGEWTTVQAATCTEAGSEERVCSKCGNKETRETEALGHDYKVDESTAVAPTCETDGKEADQKCTRCDSTIAGTSIPALGHSWSEWTVTKAATCTEAGEEQRVCSRDESHVEKRAIPATGHTEVTIPAVAATCTATGLTEGKKCSVCGEILVAQAETSALGHDWGEWTVVKEATEDEEGLETRTCNRCDAEESKTIPKADHVHALVRTAAVAATCTTNGNIEYWTCSKCGRLYSDETAQTEINAEDTVINATDHKEEIIPAAAATCTATGLTEGKKCSICGEILVAQAETPALGHSWDAGVITTEPTCTETGVKTFTCGSCKETRTEKVDATGHAFANVFTVDTEPTCTVDGSKSKHCTKCEAVTEVTTIPATGHTFGDWEEVTPSTCEGAGSHKHSCTICGYTESEATNPAGHDVEEEFTVDIAPTCTTDGSRSKHCRNCDVTFESEVIPATGHSYGDWNTTKEATCTEKGMREKVCSVCGDVATEEISALGHAWNDEPTIDKAATCTEDGSQSIHCARCNETKDVTVIPATGHQWNTEPTIDVPATESAPGAKSIHCSVCDAVKEGSTEVIPQLSPSTPTVVPTAPAAPTAPAEIQDLPAVKISKPAAAKKAVTVKWKKVTKKNLKKIQGIEIQVATDSGFTDIVKSTTAGKKKTSKKIKGLTSKQTYYVRIRAYNNAADGKHVSVWKTKKVKIK